MKCVVYYRVSTKKQGQSGLGLEAQRTIVENYLKNNTVINEFTEIETGKSANRPQLNKALQACKENNATLVVAKLDRLARNLHFVTTLQAANLLHKRDNSFHFFHISILKILYLTVLAVQNHHSKQKLNILLYSVFPFVLLGVAKV